MNESERATEFNPLKRTMFQEFQPECQTSNESKATKWNPFSHLKEAKALKQAQTRWAIEKGRYIENVLIQRPDPPISIWGNDRVRQSIAKDVISIIVEQLELPNGHFVPEDDLSIVLCDQPFKGSYEEAEIEIENKFDIEITTDQWVRLYKSGTLGELIDLIMEQGKKIPTPDVWPPRPIE